MATPATKSRIKKYLGLSVISALISAQLSSLPGLAEPKARVAAPLKNVCERSHDYVARGMSGTVGRLRDDQSIDFPRTRGYGRHRDLNELLNPVEADSLFDTGLYEMDGYRAVSRLQMGARNTGGRFNAGLCWWYTRFHRAAAYLAEFKPELTPPTKDQAKRLLSQITHFKPVTIPGYSSLTKFTYDYREEVEFVLSNWQIETTIQAPGNVIGGTFAEFITTKKARDEALRRSMMNLIDDLDAARRPIFLMIEMKGGIHALMPVEVTVNSKKEYIITYTDSNVTETSVDLKLNSDFSIDQSTIAYDIKLAHTQFDDDFTKIQNGLKTVCGSKYKIPLK